MPARDVIHFPLCAQLALRPLFPVSLPLESLAESPPWLTPIVSAGSGRTSGRLAIRVP